MRRKYTIPTYLAFGWLGVAAFLAVFGSFLPIESYQTIHGDFIDSPPFTAGHWFGVDSNGYDILSGIINGARLSIFVALVSVGVGGLVGSFLGVTAAYYRGRYDSVVSTFFNVVLSVPNLVLALALVAVLATNVDINQPVPTWRRLATLVIALTVVIVPILGRIARAATLAWSGREFVTAARSMGMRDRQIITRHIVPNVLPSLIAVGFLAVGVVIIAEASLSLLGVGIPDGASWGGMIARGRNDLEYNPHALYFPIVVLAFTVISTNHIGDVLRGGLDRREGRL
ncbi:glutathione transport system permease protein GsiD [Actinomycetes bacterium]|nr:glutathione transport system permease protein GsiD [Actinomycetes bacterium]